MDALPLSFPAPTRLLVSPILLALLCLLIGISLWTVIVCVVSVLLGVYVGRVLLVYSEGALAINVCAFLFTRRENTTRGDARCATSKGEDGDTGSTQMPWHGLRISSRVNEALEELIEQLMDNYVNVWYKGEISDDEQFINEIRYQVRYASSTLLRRALAMDLSALILREALPLIAVHVERIQRVATAGEGGQRRRSLKQEAAVFDDASDTHFTLGSRDCEIAYLRQIADYLIAHLMDESRLAGRAQDDDSPLHRPTRRAMWPSHSGRHFLRELIVFCFLMPLLDLIADPDTINRLLILLFDPEPSLCFDSLDEQCEFLHGFSSSNPGIACTGADSLIQVKLSEVVRDPRLRHAFVGYLRDVRGPCNLMEFLMQTSDIHNLQSAEMDEVHFDAWEVYRKYLHETQSSIASDALFEASIVDEFRAAIESKDMRELDRIVEKTYRLAYTRLQNEFIVPFCQSEAYLGLLCGSPPISVDDLLLGASATSTEAVDTNFSLAQFRNRLWRVIMPQTNDNPSEMEMQDRFKAVEYGYDASIELPIIDIGMYDDCDDAGFSIEHTEDMLNAESVTSGVTNPLKVFEPWRDLNRWIIEIPHIEPRRDTVTGQTMYVYMVSIERRDNDDAKSETLNRWTVARRYNEFFVLESKLLQFHGDAIRTDALPAKRTFVAKTRAFIESQRPLMEHFLQSLAQQSVLRRSELLCDFLTSEDEIRDDLVLADLNPWRVVKRVPGKFQRERGQHLKPALVSMMAGLLQPTSDTTSSSSPLQVDGRSDISSLSSLSLEQMRPRQLLFNSIFGNNYPPSAFDPIASSTDIASIHTCWTRSVMDSILFLLVKVTRIPRHVLACLVTLRSMMRATVDRVLEEALRRLLQRTLNDESALVNCIRLIQEALFAAEEIPSTDQEKSLRAELAERRVVEWVEEVLPSLTAVGGRRWRHTLSMLFLSLQHPRLNKQLTFVLLDRLLQIMFESENEDTRQRENQ